MDTLDPNFKISTGSTYHLLTKFCTLSQLFKVNAIMDPNFKMILILKILLVKVFRLIYLGFNIYAKFYLNFNIFATFQQVPPFKQVPLIICSPNFAHYHNFSR